MKISPVAILGFGTPVKSFQPIYRAYWNSCAFQRNPATHSKVIRPLIPI